MTAEDWGASLWPGRIVMSWERGRFRASSFEDALIGHSGFRVWFGAFFGQVGMGGLICLFCEVRGS